jgi:dephospho-CoA kinase
MHLAAHLAAIIAVVSTGDLRRERIQARPSWRSRDLEEQAEFGRWMRRNIADQVDTSHGTPDDAATAIAAWVTGRMN